MFEASSIRRRSQPRLGGISALSALLAVGGVHASGAIAVGQYPAAGQRPPVPTEAAATCPAGRIAEIAIRNHSVFDLTDPDRGGRLNWAYRLANRLHMRTRAEVIERELLFAKGDCYDIDRLDDSERLLRGFGFLADANIRTEPLDDGTIRVIVETQDEWSTRVEPRVMSKGAVGLQGIRLVEDNLAGTGRHIALFYEREDDERIFGASYATPHLFDTRWNLALQAAQTEFGYSYHESVAYPFVGETGRVAFRQSIDRRDRVFEVLVPLGEDDLSRVWVPVRREQFEVGAAFRWGSERYRHTLIGAAIAGERIAYPEAASFADAEVNGIMAEDLPTLSMWYNPVSSVRLMLLTGQRNVYFVRRRAIDTINGNEDIRLGVEAEASFGPTLPMVSSDRDVAVGLRLSAAGEVGSELIAGGQFAFEGRRAYEALEGLPEWHDVLAEVDGWAYFRSSQESRHLWVASASGVGGWHSRVPYQLTLGGIAGLRGYPRHVDPGGRRIVASLEHRAYLRWPAPGLFDLGTVTFVDIGKIWPGHAPFGVESPVRASVGAGIRAAFPPGSRQTFRLDLGVPVTSSLRMDDLTLTIGVGQAIGRRSILRDPQLLRSARYNISTGDFEHGL